MRGEEDQAGNTSDPSMEIPPHARRRVEGSYVLDGETGNTSACAEKRVTVWLLAFHPRKYLRMRGEERTVSIQRERQ